VSEPVPYPSDATSTGPRVRAEALEAFCRAVLLATGADAATAGAATRASAFVMAIRPDAFVPAAAFQAGMARYLDRLRGSRPAGGGAVMAPGDREWAEAARREAEGIPPRPGDGRRLRGTRPSIRAGSSRTDGRRPAGGIDARPTRERREPDMTVLKKTLAPICAALAILAASVVPTGTAAQAQEKFTLRFNHVLAPSEPYHEGFQAWAKRVEERTQGGLRMQVFHSAQLGVEEDIIEQMRQGANVGQNTDAARLGTYVRGLAVVNGPYFVESLDEVGKLSQSPTIQRWQDELAASHGLRVVCFDWVQGFRHFFTNKAVRAPEDLNRMRIRTPPAPIWQESIRALGAAPVAMAFGEMYPALQQRAIDGVELVYNNIPGGRFYEVLSHANETRHIMLVNFQVVSAAFFDRLPAEYRQVLVEECRKAGQETSARIAELETKTKEQLRQRGMKVVEDVDLAAFRKAGEKVYEKLNLVEARDAVHKDIGKR
jgi:TRAP-type C4-dicarboxylate transport system substrate-binding protein